ncbi:MAG: hypothetical protein KDG57_17165, partial [Rhodoferax sp.]|nr:hypothetical protein [Rhodoferax sp.]
MNSLLRRLQLWQKFAILGAIGVTLAGVPLYQVVTLQNSNVQVAEAEDAGLDLLRTAFALHMAVQHHERVAGTSPAARQAAQDPVDKQIKTLTSELQALGYDAAGRTAAAWSTRWDTVKAQAHQDAKAAAAQYGELDDSLLTVMDQVADTSGLSLDPVSESYYLMTVLVDHLPRLATEVHRLSVLGDEALAAKTITDRQRGE